MGEFLFILGGVSILTPAPWLLIMKITNRAFDFEY
jgi:hypothetical protein